jgi:hypothetical protein
MASGRGGCLAVICQEFDLGGARIDIFRSVANHSKRTSLDGSAMREPMGEPKADNPDAGNEGWTVISDR